MWSIVVGYGRWINGGSEFFIDDYNVLVETNSIFDVVDFYLEYCSRIMSNSRMRIFIGEGSGGLVSYNKLYNVDCSYDRDDIVEALMLGSFDG